MLTERHAKRIRGVISCFDRLLIVGTLPDICHPRACTRELNRRHVRIFDFTKFMEPLRDRIRENAEALAAKDGLTIEFIRKIDAFRKEDRVQEIVAERGTHPGLVHIFSAMETCSSFRPWHDKASGKTFLKPDSGRCLHYYFYFIDPTLGLCHVRVPTWAPFRLQFCMNGHNWLASRLRKHGIGFKLVDNAFVEIEDFARAQELADGLHAKALHRKLEGFAQQFCPVVSEFQAGYHWSLGQTEYATDIVFRRREDLAPLYDHLVRTAVHAVRAEQVATFLGKKLDPRYLGEVGNDFNTRIQGTRIRHQMGRVALKMYDKFGHVLRIETVVNDVSFFKHHRKVEHKDGRTSRELAALRKTIYSLIDLRQILAGCNRRYLEFLSALDDHARGERHLAKLTRRKRQGHRTIKGLNFFEPTEQVLLRALQRPEFNIRGLRRADVKPFVPLSNSGLSRQLHRLRALGLIKRVSRSYRYYLTRLGRAAIAAACSLTQFNIIPAIADST